MLKEYLPLRQHEEGFRRLFYDDWFDLYIWYEREGGRIVGFQLVYDKVDDPYSLTWLESDGYMHNRIDDGEPEGGGIKMSPILVPDGLFDAEPTLQRLERAMGSMEAAIRELVLGKIRAFDNGQLRKDL